jgi:flap endonuclease-1
VWEKPDEEGLVQFMVKEKAFNEERIRKSTQKLIKLRATATQGRLDGFFKVLPKPDGAKKSQDKNGAQKPQDKNGAKKPKDKKPSKKRQKTK